MLPFWAQLLTKFPAFDRRWSEAEQLAWFDAFLWLCAKLPAWVEPSSLGGE